MMRSICLMLPILWVVGSMCVLAEEDPEAAQAEREEAFEQEQGAENVQVLFEGKLLLDVTQDQDKGVVGIFLCEKRAYQLKLAQPELLSELKPCNGKFVTLKGRPRVGGKYFVAQGIHQTVANPVVPLRRPRGGGL